jgi:hypothetical protein
MEDAVVEEGVDEFLEGRRVSGCALGSEEGERYFDAEADFASCIDGCGLGLGCARGEGVASAAYVRHVFFFELAVDGGFLAVVAVYWVVVIAFCGCDVSVAGLDIDGGDGLARGCT